MFADLGQLLLKYIELGLKMTPDHLSCWSLCQYSIQNSKTITITMGFTSNRLGFVRTVTKINIINQLRTSTKSAPVLFTTLCYALGFWSPPHFSLSKRVVKQALNPGLYLPSLVVFVALVAIFYYFHTLQLGPPTRVLTDRWLAFITGEKFNRFRPTPAFSILSTSGSSSSRAISNNMTPLVRFFL